MPTTSELRRNELAVTVPDYGRLSIKVGNLSFIATWEFATAPITCALFREMLPLRKKLIHCSWSGEGVWVKLEKPKRVLQREHDTCHPKAGQLLLYLGDRSEPEFLIPCGFCIFNSSSGVLCGNHFATISEGVDRLSELQTLVLWHGAQDCIIEEIAAD